MPDSPSARVQVSWSEVTHYTADFTIPFSDLETDKARAWLESNLPFDTAKEIGTEIERGSIDGYVIP